MASGIDVIFTGLMLICLDGGTDCPKGLHSEYSNTAWVVRADGESKPCKWQDSTVTTLELEFSGQDFTFDNNSQWVKDHCKSEQIGVAEKFTCTLTERKLCINPDPKPASGNQRLETSLEGLLRINEIDPRFKELRADRLEDQKYISSRIQFPAGSIGAGEKWPPASAHAGKPRLWFRSNGSDEGALPRELSDRLRVLYEGAQNLELTSCNSKSLIVLTPKQGVDRAQAIFRNTASALSAETVGLFDNLTYLLWYYPLGSWNTDSGLCPDYTPDNKSAVLLSCLHKSDKRCASYPPGDRISTTWPPFLGPSF